MTNTVKTFGNSDSDPDVQLDGVLPKLATALATCEAASLRDDRSVQYGRQLLVIPSKPAAEELRKAARYQFETTTVIRWLGSDQQIRQALGVVRDISITGVFVENPAPIPIHANVELDIALPSSQPSSYRLVLNFEGRVVRADCRDGRKGFAVAGCLHIASNSSIDISRQRY
jgi:hypothetical protein